MAANETPNTPIQYDDKNAIVAIKRTGNKLKKYPNERPYIIEVAAPVLHD